MNLKLRNLVLLTTAVVGLAAPAGASTLWDQSSIDAFGAGYFNSISGSPPLGLTSYAVCDVTVSSAWVIESVSMYYSALDQGWGGAISTGVLHIFPKTGAFPTEDPASSPVVAMTGTLEGDHFVVTASGLNIALAPGDYWIGITPVAPSGFFGPEICLSTAAHYGDDTVTYDPDAFPGPPAWVDFNPGVDAAILIEGQGGAVATSESTWGQIKALYR